MLKLKNNISLFYLALPLILPNSLRSISIPAFLIAGTIAGITSYKKIGKTPLYIFLLTTAITLIYTLIGANKAHPDSIYWIIFIYIISPLMWISLWSNIFEFNAFETVVKYFSIYTFVGCLTVYIFIYLFLNFGPTSVELFIKESNVDLSEGKIGITMHIFGPLIFFTSAFLASPKVIEKRFRPALIIIIIITAIISGRTALILSALIGIFIKTATTIKSLNILNILKFFIICIFLIILFEILLATLADEQNIGLSTIFSFAAEKIIQGGGAERLNQLNSLLEGIYDSYFMGVGHGVNTEVIRNDEHPWKYELLWISTIFHTGIIGFIVYSTPVLLIIITIVQINQRYLFNERDLFVAAGLISILIASNTNPYLQSFDFQWMLVMPCIYFYKRRIEIKKRDVA